MPSNDEINAAFDAVQPDLRVLVDQFVPSFMQNTVLQDLASQQGRQDVVNIIRKALLAAEGVRNKPAKASSPR